MNPLQPRADDLRANVTEAGLQIAARSARGPREHNEDSLSIIPAGTGVLLAMADGLGGHRGGEIASSAFCDALTALADEHLTGVASEAALTRLYEAAAGHLQQVLTQSDVQAARTTCALVWVHPQRIVALTVGDTRIYILREGEIGSWRSRDHSVAELALYDLQQEGSTAVAEADRARLYKSIGIKSVPDPAVASHPPLRAGDNIVVCSDGVWGYVAVDDLLDVGASPDLCAAVDAVLERAAAFAGAEGDNATLIVARPQPVAVPEGRLARTPGLLRGSRVVLPALGSLMVRDVLRATTESVTYVTQDEEQQVRWLKELDAGLQPDALSEAYLPGTRRPSAVLCSPLELAKTENVQLVGLAPAGSTPLGWPANAPVELPAEFSRNAFAALAECHRDGIFHGVIRPRNISCGANGRVMFLEPLLHKDSATAHQDVVDLLRVCCALEQPGSARRARLQALSHLDKLSAADVVADLDGRTGVDGWLWRSLLRPSLPAIAIAAGIIIAWSVMRPYGQIAPTHAPAHMQAQRDAAAASAVRVSASTGQQFPVTSDVPATKTTAPSPGVTGADAVVGLQITDEDGKAVPRKALRVWVNALAIDANKGFSGRPGTYNVVVEAAGFERYERVLDASRGGHMEVPVQLRKIPVAAHESQAAAPAAELVDAGTGSAADASVSSNVPRQTDKPPPCPGGATPCLNLAPPPCAASGDCSHRDVESVTTRPDSAPPAPKVRPEAPESPALDHGTGPPGR